MTATTVPTTGHMPPDEEPTLDALDAGTTSEAVRIPRY